MAPPPKLASAGVWTRYLHLLVARLGGCVTGLAPQAREVLIWRAGLGTGRSFDRAQVARLLDTSVPRERALEQRAAAELRRTAARHGCELGASLAATMGIPAAVSAGLHQALEPLAASAPGGPTASLQAPSVAAPSPAPSATASLPATGSAAAAAHRSHPASRSHPRPTGDAGTPGSSKLNLSDGGSGSGGWPSLLLIALGVVGAAILLTPLARKVMPEAATQLGAVRLSRAGRNRDPEGAFNLGCQLVERGDLSGALAAYRRAADRGHPSGASNLGVLLEQRGDVDGALDAYHKAAERGDPQGAFNLGGLLAERGDLSGAAAAYARAEERGDADVASAARSAIDELGARDTA